MRARLTLRTLCSQAQLGSIFVTQLVLGNFMEVGLPWLRDLYARWRQTRGTEFHVRFRQNVPRSVARWCVNSVH